jgi:hypothetical protein
VPGDDHPGAALLLEATHRSKSRLQSGVIGLDVVRLTDMEARLAASPDSSAAGEGGREDVAGAGDQ